MDVILIEGPNRSRFEVNNNHVAQDFNGPLLGLQPSLVGDDFVPKNLANNGSKERLLKALASFDTKLSGATNNDTNWLREVAKASFEEAYGIGAPQASRKAEHFTVNLVNFLASKANSLKVWLFRLLKILPTLKIEDRSIFVDQLRQAKRMLDSASTVADQTIKTFS